MPWFIIPIVMSIVTATGAIVSINAAKQEQKKLIKVQKKLVDIRNLKNEVVTKLNILIEQDKANKKIEEAAAKTPQISMYMPHLIVGGSILLGGIIIMSSKRRN